MKDFLELIPSHTMREYLKKIGYNFTDSECATIIYQLYLPFPKRDKLLMELAEETGDEELRNQIIHRIAYDKGQLERLSKHLTGGEVRRNEKGEVVSYWTTEQEAECNEKIRKGALGKSFEERYIEIPHPFWHGSRVRIVGGSQEFVVRDCKSREEETIFLEKLKKRTGAATLQDCLDYIDTSIAIYIENGEGEEEYGHVSPFDLEFV